MVPRSDTLPWGMLHMRSKGALRRAVDALPRPSAAPARRPPLVWELPLVVVLFLGYKFGRRAANGQFADAYANAERVWDLERWAHLPSEAWVQDLLLHSETLVRGINVYYATVHFPSMAVFLAWLYFFRPSHYLWGRWVLTWLTGAALVLHLLVPLAPPRLYRATGLIDTGMRYGPAVYDGQRPDPDSMANQFAAMPSLHVGWAVMIALTLIVATRSPLRWLGLLHPLITVVTVVATGHHYWLDGIVACALLTVIVLVLRPPRLPADPQASAPPRDADTRRPTTGVPAAVAADGGRPAEAEVDETATGTAGQRSRRERETVGWARRSG